MKKMDVLLSAFLILIIVVFVTFTTVVTYDRHKRDSLFDEYFILQQKIVLDDIYSEYMEVREGEIDSCTILEKQVESSLELSNHLLKRLKTINQFGIVPSDNRIKYVFILTNVKLWLQQQRIEKECGQEKNIILYFYPEIPEPTKEKAMWDTKTVFFERKIENINNHCKIDGLIALPYIKDIPILEQMIEDFNIEQPLAIIINDKVFYDEDLPSTITKDFLDQIGC